MGSFTVSSFSTLLSLFDDENGSCLPTRIQSVKMFFCVEANPEWKPGTGSTEST